MIRRGGEVADKGVPVMSGESLFRGPQPVACKGCLATGGALRPLSGSQAAAFQDLIRSIVSPDVCPNYVCRVCLALLKKYTAFRTQCHKAQVLCQGLYSRGIQISTDEIKSIAQDSQLLQQTKLPNININPKPRQLQAIKIHLLNINPEEYKTNDIQENNYDYKELKPASVKVEYLPEQNCESENDITMVSDGNNSDVEDEIPHKKTNSSSIKKDLDILDSISNLSDTDSDMKLDSTESSDSDIDLFNYKKKCLRKRTKESNKKTQRAKKSKLERKIDKEKENKSTTKLECKEEINKSKQTKAVKEKSITKKDKTKPKHKSSLKDIKELIDHLKTENEKIKNNVSKIDSVIPTNTSKKPRKLGKEDRKRDKTEQEYNMKIVQLSKEEQLKKLEARKDSLNYKRATYKCNLCFRGFIKEFTYKNHIAKHDPSQGDHICDVCSLRFPNESAVKKHVSSFHEFDYTCNECNHVSKYLYSAVVHFRWHKGVKYDCKICGKTFDKPTSVMGHMHLKHGGSTVCTICEEMFIGEKGLDRHMKMSHKDAIGAVCASCGVQFHSASALRTHRPQGACDRNLRPCPACGECFATEILLQTHKDENHKKRGFVCETCGKQYGDARSYHGHVTYHLYNKPGTSKPFKANPDQPPVTWMCEICGRSYKSKAALNLHHLSHTGEKPFHCDFCQQGYKSKASLQAHISKHTGAPPRYSCNFCPKKFKHDSNRKRHESAVHRKLRPYKCTLCENTYQDKHTLQTHVNTKHHGLPWPKRVRKVNNTYSPPHLHFYNIPNYPHK